MSQDNADDFSDDEIFFGQLTLKEIRKNIFMNHKRQTVGCINAGPEDDCNKSLKIIETHSTPNILSVIKPHPNPEPSNYLSNSSPDIVANWDIKDAEDSFLKIEQIVEGLSISPSQNGLDNTLEVVEFILKNGSTSDKDQCELKNELSEKEQLNDNIHSVNSQVCILQVNSDIPFQQLGCSSIIDNKTLNKQSLCLKSKAATPAKNLIRPENEIYKTPSTQLKLKGVIFKTPGNHLVHKKPTLTPSKKQYEHIVSPVASYIKNSPLVPLLKNIRPVKPLSGASHIPQRIKNPGNANVCNKENACLPSTAYKCAKETKVINVPDGNKLPQSQWAHQVVSSIPRGIVMKHIHRDICSSKKLLKHQQEDSFNDLTLHQADVSVCTQKFALKTPKNH